MKKSTYRINLGGTGDITGPDNQTWTAAGPNYQNDGCSIDGGLTAQREADLPLYPKSHTELLRSEVYDMQSITFQVPKGKYDITLIVGATFEVLKSLSHKYQIRIKGTEIVEEINPYKAAQGFGRAGIITLFGVPIEENRITLKFSPQANISGISIVASKTKSYSFHTHAPAIEAVPSVPEQVDPQIKKVLFLGNSGTFYWAIPETLSRLTGLADPSLTVSPKSIVEGGVDVEWLWKNREVHKQIKQKTHVVVIQDRSSGPFEQPKKFEFYTSKLINFIREMGVLPVLYAYSAPLSHTPENRRFLLDKYLSLGRKEDVPVIPCAAALIKALHDDPKTNYHNPDHHHLGMFGSFLYHCCFFRCFTGKRAAEIPEFATHAGHVLLPKAKGRYIAKIADNVCDEYYQCEPILRLCR